MTIHDDLHVLHILSMQVVQLVAPVRSVVLPRGTCVVLCLLRTLAWQSGIDILDNETDLKSTYVAIFECSKKVCP